MPVKVAVLGTRYQDLSIEEEILAPLDAALVIGDGGSPDAIVDVAHGARVILAGSGPRFDADTLKRVEAGAIVRYGVGTESIDAGAAADLGMWVAYVPDYGTEAVAIHTLTLVLAAARRLPVADATVKSGGGVWPICGPCTCRRLEPPAWWDWVASDVGWPSFSRAWATR